MKKRIRASLVALFVLALAIPMFLHFYQWNQWKNNESNRPRPTAVELAAELKSLPLPGHFRAESTFDRFSSVGATGSLDTEVPPAQVMENIKPLILAEGWTLKREKIESPLAAYFCRKGRSLVIEPVTQGGVTRVEVGVTWTFYTAAMSYCP